MNRTWLKAQVCPIPKTLPIFVKPKTCPAFPALFLDTAKAEDMPNHEYSFSLTKAGRQPQYTQRMPLDHLALVVRVIYIPRLHGTVAMEKTVLGKIPHPEHCSDNRLQYTLSLHM